MNKKGTGSAYDKWNIYVVICDIAVNQVMVTTVKLSMWWLQVSLEEPWFSSLLASSNSLSRTSWYEPQYLEYRLNWEIYTPYTGAARFWLPLWYLQTLVLYWSFTVPLVSSLYWRTWKKCCVCLHTTSGFYEIDIIS